ncbi:hypothetical protein J7L09_02750 [bacterium]|nr:hypothetical protein [bacterium]
MKINQKYAKLENMVDKASKIKASQRVIFWGLSPIKKGALAPLFGVLFLVFLIIQIGCKVQKEKRKEKKDRCLICSRGIEIPIQSNKKTSQKQNKRDYSAYHFLSPS